MKNILPIQHLFILFLFSFISAFEGEKHEDALSLIYHHRHYIQSIYDSCYYEFAGRTKKCTFSKRKELINIFDKPLSYWQQYKYEIFDAILRSQGHLKYTDQNGGSSLINNDVFIEIYIRIIKENDSKRSPTTRALRCLLYKTPYKKLLKYSSQIKAAVSNVTEFDNVYYSRSEKVKLLSLLSLSKDEIKGILKFEFLPENQRKYAKRVFSHEEDNLKTRKIKNQLLPLSVRVRFGDKDAEKELIGMYDSEKRYKWKSNLVEDLAIAGSDSCIKHLIINFNQPIFNRSGKDICESIRYPILKALRRYHPELEILNTRLDKSIRLNELRKDYDLVEAYLKEFKKWAYETYGVKPRDPDPQPILSHICIKE